MIKTDGLRRVNTVAQNNKGMVTSDAVYNNLLNGEMLYLNFNSGAAYTSKSYDELKGYSLLIIRFFYKNIAGNYYPCLYPIHSDNANCCMGIAPDGRSMVIRSVTYNSTTGTITLGQGYSGTIGNFQADDTALFPVQAYRIKIAKPIV